MKAANRCALCAPRTPWGGTQRKKATTPGEGSPASSKLDQNIILTEEPHINTRGYCSPARPESKRKIATNEIFFCVPYGPGARAGRPFAGRGVSMREAKADVVAAVEATGQPSGDGVHLGFAGDRGRASDAQVGRHRDRLAQRESRLIDRDEKKTRADLGGSARVAQIRRRAIWSPA